MTFKTGSTEQRISSPPLLNAAAGSHDDAPSTIVAPTVKSDGDEALPLPVTLPTGPLPGDPTCTAHSLAAPTAQPAIAPALFRAPERYEILNEHGRGGLGKVSRAHDRDLGRDVAIKELISRNTVGEVRFLREAMITARLEHPGIVPMYEAGRWPDGTPYYAMKLVSGRSLRDLIAERTTVDQRIGLLHHVIAVADAIAYAHGRNIIHRDLKPANVIVGDFGETIVIDWGLAKDLSISADEPTATGTPSGSPNTNDLTATGAVLGTPSYMAPEQERGDAVDQRADVFAIGALLWELCSLQKVPPTKLRHRHRLLRKAGIDQDLAVIIDKALDPDPARRYRNAGLLAADLKAFKSGVRISARSYSLFALFAHWTRRHRALALTAAIAIAFTVLASILYVRNIDAERLRAVDSEQAAERSRLRSEESLAELTLKNAQLLLTSDPSAAIDVLASYNGTDIDHANQIRGEASGLGIALLRATPHTGNVLWAEGTATGQVISLSNDGTIKRTSLDGKSVILTHDVSRRGLVAFSAPRQLLAYSCDPSDVCLLDILHGTWMPIRRMTRDGPIEAPAGISFSPSGNLLALISQSGVLKIINIADVTRPLLRLNKSIRGGFDVLFLDENVAVAGTSQNVEFVYMDGRSESLATPGGSYWAASRSEHKLAIATNAGVASILEDRPRPVLLKNNLCNSPIVGLRFIEGQQAISYACRDGIIGTWDLRHNTTRVRARLEGHADHITVSPAGDYIVAAGGNGTVTVIDLLTDLTTTYRGHGSRLTSITPPTSEHSFLISGDAYGAIRVWPPPRRVARVVSTLSTPLYNAIFLPKTKTALATSWLASLITFSPSDGLRTIEEHQTKNIYLEQSNSGTSFATYGLNDIVEIWSMFPIKRIALISTGHGSISKLHFIGEDGSFITSGNDGRLVRWSSSGDGEVFARISQQIEDFTFVQKTVSIVFATLDGMTWRIGANGVALPLGKAGDRVNRLYTLPDGRTVYVGYANGDVIAIDTESWRQALVQHASGSIREIKSAKDGSVIAIATNDGTIRILKLSNPKLKSQDTSWTTLRVRARDIALTSDGLLIASGTDGMIWLYSIRDRHWVCLPTGAIDLGQVAVTTSGDAALIADLEGRLIWIDLDSARKLL